MVAIPSPETVGLARPLALLALVPVAAALWFLVLRGGAGEAGRRTRWGLFASRLLIAACLIGAAAGPYTVATRETPGDPSVRLLVDDSASMAVLPDAADGLERRIEAQGVPVSATTVADGNESRVGDGIAANVRPGGSLVVVSDGRVTGGRSLDSAAELARSANATVSAVSLSTRDAERYVSLHGPAKTSAGIENRFLVRVGGANLDGRETRVTVSADGEQVASGTVTGSGAVEFAHRFGETGTHRLVARLEGQDRYAANDVFYKTVRVVEKPRVLYVTRAGHPLEAYLSRLYDVTTATEVPADLSPYHAVVLQDVAAPDVGDVDALQRFVIEGNGLVVVGGPNAYGNGGYEASTLGSMLPVRVGESGGRKASIVLAVDVSGSSEAGMRVQKAIALDVLRQLGGQNEVGVVAFNHRAHRIADLVPLSESRATLEDRIRRLQAGGGTRIAAGLRGAGEILGEGGGTVILVTDGFNRAGDPRRAALRLRERGVRVIPVGVGRRIDAGLLDELAAVSDGTFYRANETSRLRILFGDEERRYSGSGLTVVDDGHFITAGVETTASPGRSNRVAVKRGADFLVAAATGRPAVASWRYGLGRAVSITAYAPDGGLGGLLSRPDSLLVSKSVNWAIGDPERKGSGVRVRDGRVGEPVTVTYAGEPPESELSFTKVGEGTYRATVTPREPGFRSVLDAEYAANYPREYAGFGTSTALRAAVETTGGRTFEPGEAAGIARFARQRATRLREVRTEWDAALLIAALLVFLVEVAARRIRTDNRLS